MRIDGGCFCGAIAYEAEVDPARTTVCHCTDCQQLTGTAYRVLVTAEPGCYHIIRGKPKEFIKTGSSGARRAQGFCADCGSHLYSTSVGDASRVYIIRTGTARQRADLVPHKEIWHRSALPWLPKFEATEIVEKQ